MKFELGDRIEYTPEREPYGISGVGVVIDLIGNGVSAVVEFKHGARMHFTAESLAYARIVPAGEIQRRLLRETQKRLDLETGTVFPCDQAESLRRMCQANRV